MNSTCGAQTYTVKYHGAVIAADVMVQILPGFLRAVNSQLPSVLSPTPVLFGELFRSPC